MTELPDFRSFFRALWDHDPFAWQTMLAQRVTTDSWPRALDLPTASGKTACIEIALYALAAQAGRPTADRTAPRRIWFVVDRRIVVDEAYRRAERVARTLREARNGVLREISKCLCDISGTERPLAVARLRGGVLRDDGWARLPSQPAVITSTVDQLGSRLLFRSYGNSRLSAPIFAGLAANDSLIFLDEAHCSVPFMQTLRAIETFRGPRWAQEHLPSPFTFAILSATPPRDIPRETVFPGAARKQALDHPLLHQRLTASKLADLVTVKTGAQDASDPLVREAVHRAAAYLDLGKQCVAVMVNRVRTAQACAAALRETLVADRADVILLTGRMRPYDRDRLVELWEPYLRAASPTNPVKPIVLVTTQCLEVGADFSFDALVTECASLDALRQRFGRLDRLGTAGTSPAVILIRHVDADPTNAKPDPVYGSVLPATWKMLNDRATGCTVDFGVEPLNALLRDLDDPELYVAPAPDAPMLLPAHLDLLCQTSLPLHPEPDVQLYLHGKGRGVAEVQVLWRADLSLRAPNTWPDIVALCPPVSGEMLTISLYQLRRFLRSAVQSDEASDVEGVPSPTDHESVIWTRPCLAWRGRDRSRIIRQADDITPGDVIVLPAAYGMGEFGHAAGDDGLGEEKLDIWERALEASARPLALRISPALLAPWCGCGPVADLVRVTESLELARDTLDEAIDAVLACQPADEALPPPPPSWWLTRLQSVRGGKVESHPGGGVLLIQRRVRENLRKAELDLFADDDDLTSASGESVPLGEHTDLVRRTVAKLAERCLPRNYHAALQNAALWHDAGKLDVRFQTLLHQGDELAALLTEKPLAKSTEVPNTPARRRIIREASKLPDNFRHEMLSLQLASRDAQNLADEQERELVLHLVATHHGHGRPFAPVCVDGAPPAIDGIIADAVRVAMSDAERCVQVPPHRLDGEVADRFWRLVRRYGWWGLAYLESMLRLADWYASSLRLSEITLKERAHEPA